MPERTPYTRNIPRSSVRVVPGKDTFASTRSPSTVFTVIICTRMFGAGWPSMSNTVPVTTAPRVSVIFRSVTGFRPSTSTLVPGPRAGRVAPEYIGKYAGLVTYT